MKNVSIRKTVRQAVVLFGFILLFVVPAGAATFTVNSLLDTVDSIPGDGLCADEDENCTLRAAIMEANALSGTDTINIPAGTYTLTRTINPADDTEEYLDLDISESVTINGAGISDTIITIVSDSIGGKDRIFEITSGTVTISNLKVTGGYAQSFSGLAAAYGSGIINLGTLTLEDVVIDGNGPTLGAGPMGGGVCSFSGSSNSIYMNRVTVSNNIGGHGGGIYLHKSFLTLMNSTVSGNEGSTDGAGIYVDEGGFDIGNSTISGNIGGWRGAGIYHERTTSAVYTIYDTTITGNQSGGVYNYSGYIEISTSIIADNGPNPQSYDLYKEPASGYFRSGGYNIIGDSDEQFPEDPTDQIGTTQNPFDPKIGPLADNGGPTMTHALLAESTAIDWRTETYAATDQRGASRPIDGDGDSTATWDIGPYEYGGKGIISFSTSAYTVDEDGGSATITVSRSGSSDGAVSVNYATSDGTATAGTDYTAASDTLNWTNGDTADKTFSVNITDDDDPEGDETINLTLSDITGGADLGTSSATLTIIEDTGNKSSLAPIIYLLLSE